MVGQSLLIAQETIGQLFLLDGWFSTQWREAQANYWVQICTWQLHKYASSKFLKCGTWLGICRNTKTRLSIPMTKTWHNILEVDIVRNSKQSMTFNLWHYPDA